MSSGWFQKSDIKPSIYFRTIESLLGSKLNAVLESNFISAQGFEAGKADDYTQFMIERNKLLQDKITTLIDAEVL